MNVISEQSDFLLTHEISGTSRRQIVQAGSLPVDIMPVEADASVFSGPATHCFSLAIAMRKSDDPFEVDFGEGRRTLQGSVTGQELYLNPTLSDTDWSMPSVSALMLNTPFSALADRLEIPVDRLTAGLRPWHDRPFVDPRLRSLCFAIREHAHRDGPFGALAVDQALLAIVSILLATARGARSVGSEEYRLSPAGLGAAFDFVEAQLERPIALAELAACANLPLASFGRAFHDATGQTPHQYVLSRRIARAQEMLASGDVALAEVAYACGFASQSHMTDVFRQKLGVTPGRYRKEVRG